jgi:2-dehydropantoate 2-reductase
VNILVLGAGAIGSVYGALLSAHHDVTLIGTEAHMRAINAHGLTLSGARSGVFRLRAATAVGHIERDTLVILTTKANASAAAVAPLVPLLPTGVTFLCVQNGLYAERVVRDLVGDRAVTLRAITQHGAVLRGPGQVEYTVLGYTLIEDHERAPMLASVLNGSALDGRIVPDMKREMWRKVIFNCVINPITSIVGCEVGGISSPGLAPTKQLVIDECLAVAAADGVTFDEDFMDQIDRVFSTSKTVVSTLQDLRKGRRTEIDFLNGAVVALGERYGIACPVNGALTTIIKELEKGRSGG